MRLSELLAICRRELAGAPDAAPGEAEILVSAVTGIPRGRLFLSMDDDVGDAAGRLLPLLHLVAAQRLLADPTPISRLRGRWAEVDGVRIMPTFHPAYLLRSPEEKKKAWEDLQLVMKELGRAPRR